MADQKQSASDGALAVQSGRDTHIHHGLGPDDVSKIISDLAQNLLLPAYADAARRVVDERMQDFKLELLRRFDRDPKARADAFAEPDFQATVTEAQRAHARVGNIETRDILIDLIARRSAETERTRLSLSLNQAVERAALLTREEFAWLTLCYALKYVAFSPANYHAFLSFMRTCVVPFVNDVPAGASVFSYLHAQGCVTGGVLSQSLHGLLVHTYAGMLSDGFTQSELDEKISAGEQQLIASISLLMPCLHDQTKGQLAVTSERIFEERAAAADLSADLKQRLWTLFRGTLWKETELVERLAKDIPEARDLFDKWEQAGMSAAGLTSVGVAIAHANLQRVHSGFDANLSIWIT